MQILFDLTKIADQLPGSPDEFFIDHYQDTDRIVRHATGEVVGVLKAGKVSTRTQQADPSAPPVTVSVDLVADPAEFEAH